MYLVPKFGKEAENNGIIKFTSMGYLKEKVAAPV
jgi:hypothetical protein